MNEMLIAGIVVFGFCYLAYRWISPHSQYTTDKNPYRRWCVRCGQRQEFTHYAWQDVSNGWWEDMGEIKNKACVCHKDADNTR